MLYNCRTPPHITGETVRLSCTGLQALSLYQHRVVEIREVIPGATWNCCATANNPADLLTRGISFELLRSPDNLWWKGPPWLTTPHNWPTWQPEPTVHLHAAAAIAGEFTPQPTASPDIGLHQIIKLTNYSSLNKLLAVTSYTFRFVNNLYRSRNGPVTAEELSSAQTRWVQACQELVYPMEMASAKSQYVRPEVKRPPLVRQLRLLLMTRAFCGVGDGYTMLHSVSWPGSHTCYHRTIT